MHLNLNKPLDLEIAKFLEKLTQKLKPRSSDELLKQIILHYKELRSKTTGLEEDYSRKLESCQQELDRLRVEIETPSLATY